MTAIARAVGVGRDEHVTAAADWNIPCQETGPESEQQQCFEPCCEVLLICSPSDIYPYFNAKRDVESLGIDREVQCVLRNAHVTQNA